jgi:hypothetical protein
MMTIQLIQEYYEPESKERLLEIQETLLNNLNNKYIDKLVLLNEKKYAFVDNLLDSHIKLNVIVTGKRLTFKDALIYANKQVSNTIVIISNSDIYFDPILIDKSFENINNVLLDNPNTVIALSRSELVHKSSQDTWILKTPLKDSREFKDFREFNFFLGVLGCDNHVAYLFKKCGHTLRNLPYDIVTIHNHKSNYRTYNKNNPVRGNYLDVDVQEIVRPIIKIDENTVIINYKNKNL